MHPPIHLAVSWLIAHRLPERRDRILVTWSGVVPDLDALSLLGGVATYSQYHHVLTHGLIAAVVGTVIWTALARERLKVALLSLLAFHVHILCDLIGSGAEGQPWAVYYFYPFSWYEFFIPHGWDLASPENALVWLLAVAATVWIALTRGRTFGEAFLPARADLAVVATLRRIFSRRSPQ